MRSSLSRPELPLTVALDASEDALGAYRRVLLNLLATIKANFDGTVEDIDPEFLHDLRVAVRRTRSVLSQAKGVLPDDGRGRYREGFGWLGKVTGPARDLDVHLLGWDGYTASLAPADRATLSIVRDALVGRQLAAHRHLASALRSDRTTALLAGWESWLLDPQVVPERRLAVGPVVAERISAAQRKLLADGRKIDDSSPGERLHDLRKDAKKLRYLLECFGGLLPSGRRKRFVAQLKALQDNLGEHQDAEVHTTELLDLERDMHAQREVDADVLLAMGRLRDHLERRRSEERAAFTERFASYDTKQNRKLLDDMLAEIVDP